MVNVAGRPTRWAGHARRPEPGMAVRVRIGRDWPDLATVEEIARITYGAHAQIVGPSGPVIAQVVAEVAQRHAQWDAAEAEIAEAARQAEAQLWGEVA